MLDTTYKPLASWLEEAKSEKEIEALQQVAEKNGFSYFHAFIESIKQKIGTFSDEDTDAMLAYLNKVEKVFPDPGLYSPAWDRMWNKFRAMIDDKIDILHQIPVHEREGEWQVLLDNPYSNDSITCYPRLSFAEAVYLYCYFREDLAKNEYVRLQKVVTSQLQHGGRR